MKMRMILGCSAVLMALSGGFMAGCGDDKPEIKADVAADVTSDTAEVMEDAVADSVEDALEDAVEDVAIAEDVEPEEVAEDVDPGDGVVLTEPGEFVLGTASLPSEYVFKGVWAGVADRAVAVGNDGVIASLRADGDRKSVV